MAIVSGALRPIVDFTKLMDCVAGVSVGDWVYQDAITGNLAVQATDNLSAKPVIGIVKSKPSSTTCLVLLSGIYNLNVGHGRIFIDATGSASPTAPSTGYLQVLGESFGDGKIFVGVNKMRIKRI